MNITYLNEEYELISETSGISYVHLTFVKADLAGGVGILTMHHYLFGGNRGEMNQNYVYLPASTLHEVVDIVKDRSVKSAL